MIYQAASHIAFQLNQFLKQTFDLNEDIVLVSNLVGSDGNTASHIDNKLVIFLVNLSKETAPYSQNGFSSGGGARRSVVSSPPIYLDLYLMVAANFNGSNYLEGLKFISYAINFFQRMPVFDHHNSPDLDANIEKLTMNIVNVNLHDLGSLWGMVNGKYLPSVLYQVRLLTFQSGDIQKQVSILDAPQTDTQHQS